jgi:copper transport protein
VVLFLALARRTYTTASRWAVAGGAALLAVALLAVVAAGGHGITGRWLIVGYLATLVHLVAMSLWVGGLVALALIVPKGQLWAVAARFSPIALVSVVALIVTGTINVWRQAGSWSALTGSNYGTWFFVKIGLVAAVLVVAVVSRRNVRADAPKPGRLRRTVFIEVVGMVLILIATAGLVSSAPARDVGATAPVSVSVVQGQRLAQVVLAPPVTGGTVMHVYLSSLTGTIGTESPTITVTASLPSENIKGLSIPTESAGPGHAISNDADFPIPGEWVIQVDARYGKFDEVTFVAKFTIE